MSKKKDGWASILPKDIYGNLKTWKAKVSRYRTLPEVLSDNFEKAGFHVEQTSEFGLSISPKKLTDYSILELLKAIRGKIK